jgi:hypothetical protein
MLGMETESLSSMTPKPPWDVGAILRGNKTPIRIKLSTSWIPNPWKVSPCHVTLRKFGAIYAIATASSKSVCVSINRTNGWAPHTMWNFSIDPWKHKQA